MFRFALPDISSSPLVSECVKVLKYVLQRDVALLTIVKWYSVRNAPGTQDISPKHEWQLFISTILELLGYQLDSLPLMLNYTSGPDCEVSVKNHKKRRTSDLGSQDDWDYLVDSIDHDTMSAGICGVLCIQQVPSTHGFNSSNDKLPPQTTFNTAAPLFPYIHLILFSLHLLYEDLKLNILLADCLPMLVRLLHQLSSDLRLGNYTHYYWRDYPDECPINAQLESQLSAEEFEKLTIPSYMTDNPPSIFERICHLLSEVRDIDAFPYIHNVNPLSKDILEVIGILATGILHNQVKQITPPGSRCETPTNVDRSPRYDSDLPNAHRAVLHMYAIGLEQDQLLTLPGGVGLIMVGAIQSVCESPRAGWPEDVYHLIGRLDMIPPEENPTNAHHKPPHTSVLKLRFNKDQRVAEVQRLLQSSEPVTIALQQRPEVSDHEFIEEQERHLYAICTRTMALPVGRGMMELHTATPVISEPLAIPRLCLSGRAPPRDTTVDLSHIEVVPNMNLWPLFHNGVAAGLRIAPHTKDVCSTWIAYNKPKNGSEALPEHAGFLMALGLSGHLNNFDQLNMYEYLTKCHEMTSVGLLLGIAASKRGTMDVRSTKLFSVHIESLLPPTSIELDLVQNIQVAALLGIGLLYQGTAHRHIAEVLLSEIGRPPGPEMDNSSDRECYALAAGLGLGLVVLGKGANPSGLDDLAIADTLHYYMVGGHKRPLTGSQKDKYKSPSYQIREGDCVNNNVTAPGATLALAMMYFNTGNLAVANWLEAPDSEYMLDFVCPDLLLLRMLARGLILWDHILPSKEWVEAHVPPSIKPYCLVKPRPDTQDSVDYETMNQAYCNIIAGACMAMGLRFAGSANNEAFTTLLYYCKIFTSLSAKSIAELAGKSTIETAINVILVSLAMVMAGTGELEVLRLCRHLRSRVGGGNSSVVTYGSHLATHMALGLLFLGGGSYSLSTSPESIAALICAFFPRFPTHSNDNRYHLQAFRHLYVLAVEPRLLLPKDIDTNSLCYAHIKVVYLDTPHYTDQSVTMYAPCLLPELHFLKQRKGKNYIKLFIFYCAILLFLNFRNILKTMGCVGVKQRAGCLPYVDDPHGFRTLLAQTLSTEHATSWSIPTDSILAFTSDTVILNYTKHFLESCEQNRVSTERELKLMQSLSKLSYECVTRDKLPMLRIWILILEVIRG
ncbi:hypothetical protein AAG570_010916 [Ranatra chinensis]|uniref:Anaphase-promoting complex subunit 1 n=1 Tax=Ranatra chinensis TaxID=642074 RepID=A0ABD0YJ38_9HEMI